MADDQSVNGPYYPDGEKVLWSGRPGALPGALEETERHLGSDGRFLPLLESNSVLLPNGKSAVDSRMYPFYKHIDYNAGMAYGVGNPCPATADRAAAYKKLVDDAAGTPEAAKLKAPDQYKNFNDEYIVSDTMIKKEDKNFHKYLAAMIRGSAEGNAILEKSDGSGRTLWASLQTFAKSVKGTEIALVLSEFNMIVLQGVGTELTVESYLEYLKKYTRKLRELPTDLKPPAAVEMTMVATIAHKDDQYSEKYSNRCAINEPKSFDEANALLLKVLRDRQTADLLAAFNPLQALAAAPRSSRVRVSTFHF